MDVLEEGVRLSESRLWEMQRGAYVDFGPRSWTHEGVPFQITSNAYVARQYAEIAAEFVARCNERVQFLELGTGSGKFAFLFLKHLVRLLEERGISSDRVCYYLSDLAEKNVEFWRSHPCFQSFFARGILRAFRFDPLVEEFAGDAPLFVIGNYFFDSISQDLFRVEYGQLFEGRISLKGGETINSLRESYAYVPLDGVDPYPNNPDWGFVLWEYAKEELEANFLFPVGAFDVIDRLISSQRRVVFLIGDKGFSTLEQLKSWVDPHLNRHGTFSFPVNFHALSKYVVKRGGEVLSPASPRSSFAIHLYAFGCESGCLREAYEREVDHKGVLDALECLQRFEEEVSNPTLEQFLDYLEGTEWDTTQVFYLLDRLVRLEGEKHRLSVGVERALHHFFPLTQEEGALFVKAAVLCPDSRVTLPEGMEVLPKLERGQDRLIQAFVQSVAPKEKFCFLQGGEELSQVYNTILFISPFQQLLNSQNGREKPALVKRFEKEFSFLHEMVYSDHDLEEFFSLLCAQGEVKGEHLLTFFYELRSQGNISEHQLESVLARLLKDSRVSAEEIKAFSFRGHGADRGVLQEHRLFYDTLMQCLQSHLAIDGTFHAVLFDTVSKFEDEVFLDEVISSPFLDYHEENFLAPDGRALLYVKVTLRGPFLLL